MRGRKKQSVTPDGNLNDVSVNQPMPMPDAKTDLGRCQTEVFGYGLTTSIRCVNHAEFKVRWEEGHANAGLIMCICPVCMGLLSASGDTGFTVLVCPEM